MKLIDFQKTAKTGGVVILLLLALVVTIVLGKNASSYFAKASSCQATKVTASKVTANTAVVSWETTDSTQGRVEYGTKSNSLTFSAPEASSGKAHNVPLTLLTPNTTYYYVIAIGDTRCDSALQACKDNCVPWSFTTTALSAQDAVVAPIATPTIKTAPSNIILPISPSSTSSATTSPQVTPTPALSIFCRQVQLYVGATSKEASRWATLKQYDIDTNGVINSVDIVKCQRSGR